MWAQKYSRFNNRNPWNNVERPPGSPRAMGWDAPDTEVFNQEGAGLPRGSGRRLSALTDGRGGSDRPPLLV